MSAVQEPAFEFSSTLIGFVTLSKLLSFQVPHLYIKLSVITVPSRSSGKYSVNEG